jgi:drug/metabolite transporter superfamily protein YnfA
MQPRRAAAVGIVFIAIALFYFLFPHFVDPSHVDYAGITMLVALGASMSIMAYVLFAGLKRG